MVQTHTKNFSFLAQIESVQKIKGTDLTMAGGLLQNPPTLERKMKKKKLFSKLSEFYSNFFQLKQIFFFGIMIFFHFLGRIEMDKSTIPQKLKKLIFHSIKVVTYR